MRREGELRPERRIVTGPRHRGGARERSPGLVEWFRPGEYDRVEAAARELEALGVEDLRTGVSWADWQAGGGRAWYGWLLPRLARQLRVLPSFAHTPPSMGLEPRKAAPPRRPKDYADWLDTVVSDLGRHFDWVELWNAPNALASWDHRLDPEWNAFTAMIGGASYWMQRLGKRVVLGGMRPVDPAWLDMLARRRLLDHVHAVGIHGCPGTFDAEWVGWGRSVRAVREVLERHDLRAEVWITEASFSTWQHDEARQLREFVDFLDAPVERRYWHALRDHDPDQETASGFHVDEREYHLGLRRDDGSSKLVHRLWREGGLAKVRAHLDLAQARRPRSRSRDGYALVTGGSGFIGSNLADRLASEGREVVLLDSLGRPGVEGNARWLQRRHGEGVQLVLGDVRDRFLVRELVAGAAQVFHFAAQVAVTTSLEQPAQDFGVNAQGTLNVLEALRARRTPAPLVMTSTNKVYGALPEVPLVRRGDRYEPGSADLREHGVSETRPLDFHSPYGCSKGSADQYVRDYARSYGLPTAVFRMSCIYGPRQFGTEDQGWVAHFLIRALEGLPITVYGDGRQVRDVLFVEDLVDAMLLAGRNIDRTGGEIYNIGGGPENTTSLLELIDVIGALHGRRPEVRHAAWRAGDQRWYVSDIRRFGEATGWKPSVPVLAGVTRLYTWLLGDGAERARRLEVAPQLA